MKIESIDEITMGNYINFNSRSFELKEVEIRTQ